MDTDRINQFDQVKLRTVKNVHYLSAPPGTVASPEGIWSVAAVIADSELLLVRNNVTIRIPIEDVLKTAEYSINDVLTPLGKLANM